jgi:hypothetical protein
MPKEIAIKWERRVTRMNCARNSETRSVKGNRKDEKVKLPSLREGFDDGAINNVS